MASTAFAPIANIADVGVPSGSTYLSVQEEFETLPGDGHPLLSHIGYGSPISLNASMQYQVIRDKLPPMTVALSSQIIDSGTTLNLSTTHSTLLQHGQLLLIDEELMLVTTVGTGGTVGVERDFAGTTAATHVTSSVVHLLSPLFGGSDTFVNSPFYRGEMVSFDAFRIQYGYQEDSSSTATQSFLTRGKTQREFERERHQVRAAQQLEKLLLYGKAQSLTDTVEGSPDGLYRLITSNVTTVTGNLTAKDLVDTIELILAHDNSRQNHTLIGNRNTLRIVTSLVRQYFNAEGTPETTKVGVKFTNFMTPLGDLAWMTAPTVRDGELYVIDPSDVEINPLDIRDGTGVGWVEFKRGPAELNIRANQDIYEFQGAIVMGEDRKHALIKGFTTTGTSYTGYI